MLFLHLVRLVLYRKRLNLDMKDRDSDHKPPQTTSRGSEPDTEKKCQHVTKKTIFRSEVQENPSIGVRGSDQPDKFYAMSHPSGYERNNTNTDVTESDQAHSLLHGCNHTTMMKHRSAFHSVVATHMAALCPWKSLL